MRCQQVFEFYFIYPPKQNRPQPEPAGGYLNSEFLRNLGAFEEALQMADARRLAQLARRLRLDLADAFAR
jgi:hypothetical protein